MSRPPASPARSFRTLAAGACLVLAGCGSSAVATPTVAPVSAAVAVASPSALSIVASTSTPTSQPSGPPVVTLAASNPEAALVVAWKGSGPAPSLPCTYSPAVDSAGHIWVAVCWDSRFWILDKNGHFLEAWGTQGTDPGQLDFSYPASHDSIGGIAFAPDGSFYTFDAGNLRVQHFDAKRKLLGSWGSFGTGDGQFAKPTSIAVGHDGTVFVADGARSDIQVFSADGNFVRTMATNKVGPDFGYIAVDKSDDVFVNDGETVHEFSVDGAPLLTIDLGAIAPDPAGMAFDAAGHLFVLARGDNGLEATLELGSDGSMLHHWPGTGESIVLAPDGRFAYVADVESLTLDALRLPTP